MVTIHSDLPAMPAIMSLALAQKQSKFELGLPGRQACEVDTPILTMLNFRCAVRARAAPPHSALCANSNEIEHKAIDIGTIEKDEEKEAGDMTKSLRSYCTNHFAATRPAQLGGTLSQDR